MDDSSDLELWQPLPAPSGHFGPVQDLSWEPDGGKFLLSVSSDQTTRLHASWKQEEGVVSYAPSKCFTVQVKEIFFLEFNQLTFILPPEMRMALQYKHTYPTVCCELLPILRSVFSLSLLRPGMRWPGHRYMAMTCSVLP